MTTPSVTESSSVEKYSSWEQQHDHLSPIADAFERTDRCSDNLSGRHALSWRLGGHMKLAENRSRWFHSSGRRPVPCFCGADGWDTCESPHGTWPPTKPQAVEVFSPRCAARSYCLRKCPPTCN
jgi:hypothetical protein